MLKTGKSFKRVVFKLCRRLIEAGRFPDRFSDTVLRQLWKKKFSKENLGIHRFIHMKDWLPKCCKALVVSKMKADILKAGNKGGIPNHRVEEHLVVVKYIIEKKHNQR